MTTNRTEAIMSERRDSSGIFDLHAILRGEDYLRAVRIVPSPRPRRGPWWLAAALIGGTTALSALALAAVPARPEPMTLAISHAAAPAAPPLRVVAIPHARASAPAPAAPPRANAGRPVARAAVAPRRADVSRPVARAPVAAAPSRPAAAPAHSWATGGQDAPRALDRSVDELLDQALRSTSSDPRPTAAPSLPEIPTRRQVETTLRALEGEVAMCGEGDVTARVVIAGATGEVESATVSGASSAAVSSCVARVVRTARFPRFERERFVVAFPYRL
ncbi:MAG: hypothetical protein M5U28_18485 [Sandaracinaceae bacterium]|nr:hypothetical protein [Sandaracinaceae bacterium]